MPKNRNKYYWWCQMGGWGFWALVLVLNSSIFDQKITTRLIYITLIFLASGILVTHIFREVIRRSGWLQLSIEKAFPKFIIGILITCIAGSFIRVLLFDSLHLASAAAGPNPAKKIDFWARMMAMT